MIVAALMQLFIKLNKIRVGVTLTVQLTRK
jgi:hypothetical protein